MRPHVAIAYGIDAKSGKVFEKSRDYDGLNVQPMGYEARKKDELLTQVNELAESVGASAALPLSQPFRNFTSEDNMPIGYNDPGGVYSTLEVDMRQEEHE
jgi:hypothetical protein